MDWRFAWILVKMEARSASKSCRLALNPFALCVCFPALITAQKLGVELMKHDEMECLIRGLHYLCRHDTDECYYWADPKNPSVYGCQGTRVPVHLMANPYPYIVVNIGSGVSILLVESARTFKRIGGTSVGGGTFLGLCALLTGVESFEEAIALAGQGDGSKVDKLVRDIYGGGYDRLGLSGDVVASR